jgi:DMSO/TMAO reductase YedYZ molybdopterin-dependent catalytic subunit
MTSLSEKRRAFLGRTLAGVGLVALARATDGLAPGFARGLANAQEFWTQIRGLSSEVTAVGMFYTVSKNIFDPSVDPTWKLAIKGQVESPAKLTLDEVRGLPSVTRPHTLMCISNEIGGDLISNAVWKGVALKTILETTRIRPGASKLILRARDGYSDSFPLTAALREGTILAYEMNGKPLERQHGFPLRALVMGLYGIKNVKWLSELEVVDYDYKGYWPSRGWSDTAIYKTFSRIDAPAPGAVLKRGERAWIAGVAFGGDRGIRAVEVRVDEGKVWQPARLKPGMGDHAWVLWALEWTPAVTGPATLVVRAIDGTGAVQPVGPKPPLPDGVEGLHAVSVDVR